MINQNDQKSEVAIVRCESYQIETVRKAVNRGFALLRIDEHEFKQNETILLKPNQLTAVSMDKAVTTHPIVVRCVMERLLEFGVKLKIGDSPAVVSMRRAFAKSGISDVVQEMNCEIADFVTGIDVPALPGSIVKRFCVVKDVMDSHGIVSLSKMKTHVFTILTGAIKNQFGCIPGFKKAEFHATLPDPSDFSRMLVDLTRLLKPRLYVMDAITAMEGNGPGGGTPRPMNLLLFSRDPAALDAVAADLIGMDSKDIFILEWAEKTGLGRPFDYVCLGDPIEDFRVNNFRLPVRSWLNSDSLLVKIFRRFIVAKPVILSNSCIRCGQCVEICPVKPKSLEQKDGNSIPHYHYQKCIRCYCCQEICPEVAIKIKVPILGRLLNLIRS